MSDMQKIQERFQRRLERKRQMSNTALPADTSASAIKRLSTDKLRLFVDNLLTSVSKRRSTTLTPRMADSRRKRSASVVALAAYGSLGDVNRAASSSSIYPQLLLEENLMNLTMDQLEVAELGKPRLGDYRKAQITIKESKEFQGVIDRMLKTANTSFMLGTSSWREQFTDALTVSAGQDNGEDEDDEDEQGEIEVAMGKKKIYRRPSTMDYVMHFLSVPWKLMFAAIPPTDYWGGWACFVTSILMIGLLTAVVGDLASHFGCWIGLKDAVTAISFVAIGTSVPDTFASKVSAVQDKYADNSIGNVTGSNAVNVFLGIGIAWTMAAIVHWWRGTNFYVDPGTLAFSVTVFCIEASICITIIVLRRHPLIGGELGGPFKYQVPTAFFFVSLWIIYIGISALESYCYIAGF